MKLLVLLMMVSVSPFISYGEKFNFDLKVLFEIKFDDSSKLNVHAIRDTVNEAKEDVNRETLFTKLSPNHTGITFQNSISESREFNNLLYPFMYNGGGVAVGDINNDGLLDIFFAGNMVSSKLYLNKGDMQFEDITEFAGITTDKWVSGVSMVDINNSGYLDIYLSVVSTEDAPAQERANLLFINNGDNTFTEAAESYNIADTSHTIHTAFFDYNKDGLLDMFLLNHSPGSFSRDMADSQHMSEQEQLSTGFDKLYRNNGDGTFSDVSREAGILEVTGFGLGIVVADLNNNGWPDIYVSNDIAPDDVLYINNKDGTFTDRAIDFLKHTSYAGMGMDIADFNNDGWKDILQADMIPEDFHERKKMSYGVGYNEFKARINQGFNHSYTQNTLQMNNGVDDSGDIVFSEIARIAGVAYTEWSWAALFGDFNNSGYKDILVTNGYPKAVNDYDYLIDVFQLDHTGNQSEFLDRRYQLFEQLHDIRLPNYLFENNGGIRFQNVSSEWGFSDAGYSYGAVYADLNNDGSLDIVINNLNDVASVYQNNTTELFNHNYLVIELKGPPGNPSGIGAEVVLTTASVKQYTHQTPYRGYQSSVDPRIHFGLGNNSVVDSLSIFWPDGRHELLTNLNANRKITVQHSNASNEKSISTTISRGQRIFSDVTEETDLNIEHRQNNYNDFNIQPLLHQQLSMMGPKIAIGDVDGNGMDDIYISGSADYPGRLFIQKEEANFEEFNDNQPWLNDQGNEDMRAVFFDANGNGHMDLYVTSGGYVFSPAEDALLDRLYVNRGDGRFARDHNALPRMYTSSSIVVPGDINGDGQQDLFVGGRLSPLKYPFPARSYILENDNGVFRDVTVEIAPELVEPGMITDAIWVDFDHDGLLDLVTTGEWLPVQFYKNEGGRLREVTNEIVDNPQRGWWYSLNYGDFNNDGSVDIIAGNLGLNDSFTTSEEHKFGVFAHDFNNDFTTDIVYTVEVNGKQYPFFGRAKFDRAMPSIGDQFTDFTSFAEASLTDIFSTNLINEALHYQVDTFASSIFLNNGNGRFKVEELPEEAQVAPVKSIITSDLNGDGNLDIIIAGNISETHPDVAKSDAGNGLLLYGDGEGGFVPVPAFESGLYLPGNVKDQKLIDTDDGRLLFIANNGELLQVLKINSD